MAHIKCRFEKPVCALGAYVLEFPCEGDDLCEHYVASIPDMIGSRCNNCFAKKREFEKTVKKYEYECDENDIGWLFIGNRQIDLGNIEYLEIDGRILINEEK